MGRKGDIGKAIRAEVELARRVAILNRIESEWFELCRE